MSKYSTERNESFGALVRLDDTSPIDSDVSDSKSQAGFLMLELMVALVVLAIVGLAVTTSAYSGLRFQKQAEIGNFARNIAVSRIETLAGVPTASLSSSYNETNTSVTQTGTNVVFRRSTTITTNADGSKTVSVTVSSTSALLSSPITLTSQFASWELTSG